MTAHLSVVVFDSFLEALRFGRRVHDLDRHGGLAVEVLVVVHRIDRDNVVVVEVGGSTSHPAPTIGTWSALVGALLAVPLLDRPAGTGSKGALSGELDPGRADLGESAELVRNLRRIMVSGTSAVGLFTVEDRDGALQRLVAGEFPGGRFVSGAVPVPAAIG